MPYIAGQLGERRVCLYSIVFDCCERCGCSSPRGQTWYAYPTCWCPRPNVAVHTLVTTSANTATGKERDIYSSVLTILLYTRGIKSFYIKNSAFVSISPPCRASTSRASCTRTSSSMFGISAGRSRSGRTGATTLIKPMPSSTLSTVPIGGAWTR